MPDSASARRGHELLPPRSPPEPYSILFEPVPIGPLVARNRFFQVPHCNGMGYRDPGAQAAMRKVKAEGGWAVVCTEQAEIHRDFGHHAVHRAADLGQPGSPGAGPGAAGAIHEGGALAGIELCHNGLNAPNLYTRETPLAPHHLPVATYGYDPVQARMMTKQDLADLRRWHRNAVLRAMRRLRRPLRVRRALLRRHRALPFAAVQPAHRRVRRQRPQPDAAAPRDPRGHQRGRRRPGRRRLPDQRGRGARRRGPGPRRHRGEILGETRRAARPVGLRAGHLGSRLGDLTVRARRAIRRNSSPG